MRTAIVSAMHEELSAVLALMPDEARQVAAGRGGGSGHLADARQHRHHFTSVQVADPELAAGGDRFVSTDAECRALRSALPDALAVEMEGAAVAQVCHDFGVPFAAVRTISDRADDEAHVDFARFVREVASRHSAAIVQALLA